MATDEAYDLATQWIDDTDTYPPGGPSNEEVSDVLQSDKLVVAPSSVPTATPELINHSANTLMTAPSPVLAFAPNGVTLVVTRNMFLIVWLPRKVVMQFMIIELLGIFLL